MSSVTLAASALVDLAIAATFVAVGWRFAARRGGASGTAVRAFQTWWFGLAFTAFVNAAREALAAAGAHESSGALVLLGLLHAGYYVALCAAVWGLLTYLVYLYTGDGAWAARLGVFYAAYAGVALWLVARMDIVGVKPERWFVQWSYANPTGGPLVVVLVLLLLLPQIGAAIAYLGLRRSVTDPIARRRIPRVAWPLIVWLGLSLVAPFLQLGRFEWWQAGGRLVGLGAALVILSAYRPPLVAPRRTDADARDDLDAHASERRETLRRRGEALAMRAKELV